MALPLGAQSNQADTSTRSLPADPEPNPETYQAAMGYYFTASQSGDWLAAEATLSELRRLYPANPWPTLVLGHVYFSSGRNAQAEQVYRQAANEFSIAEIELGEIVASINLQNLLANRRQWDDAARQVTRIKRLTDSTENIEVKIRGLKSQAEYNILRGQDLGQARALLTEAQQASSALNSYSLQHGVLFSLANLESSVGRFQQAAVYFQELASLAKAEGDTASLSKAQFDAANSLLEGLTEAPELNNRSNIIALAQLALENATQSNNDYILALAHRLLGELWLGSNPDESVAHFNACIEIAQNQDYSATVSDCLLFKARAVVQKDAPEGISLVDQALTLVEGVQPPAMVRAWQHHMRVSWQAKPIDMAIADGERALAMIETLRNLQSSELERAGVLSAWTRNYYWLSGQLLTVGANHYANDAFAIIERMRARVLYERVQWANSSLKVASPTSDNTQDARREQLAVISELNKRILLSTDLATQYRLSAKLKRVEQDLARHETVGSWQGDIDIPTITEIQQQLASDEIMLSFQLGAEVDAGGEFAGGGWLFAISQNKVIVNKIPGRGHLRASVPVFLGMFDTKADSPAQAIAAQALYTKLFGQVLDDFGPEIKRLIIIPDDILYRFPMAALRNPANQRSLIEDYQITIVPSATMWHHWQESVPKKIPGAALVFANPEVSWAMAGNVSATRSWAPGTLAQISSLPAAEEEGKEIASVLANGSVLEWRDEASEGKFKTIDKTPFGIVHFAAHAVIDEQNPDRSAVILADSDLEDGLLQAREIANLEAVPPLVVLASCQGANGSLVRGEGVLGLARSFYIAGAGAVVGNLWPVQDDHARIFMRPFYAALKRGQTATQAFNSAQRQAQRAGLPASVWAGFQLMGYGNMRLAQHHLL